MVGNLPIERVNQLRAQGYTNSQIIDVLQRDGHSSAEIFDALNHSGVSDAGASTPASPPPPPSPPPIPEMAEIPQPMSPPTPPPSPPPSMEAAPAPSMPPPPPTIPPIPTASPTPVTTMPPPMPSNLPDTMPDPHMHRPSHHPKDASVSTEEYVEAIIDEKWAELEDDIQKVVEWKNRSEQKIQLLAQQVDGLKDRFDKLHAALIGKIESYDKNIIEVGAEIKAMEKVFSKVLPVFTDNVKQLNDITDRMDKKTKN